MWNPKVPLIFQFYEVFLKVGVTKWRKLQVTRRQRDRLATGSMALLTNTVRTPTLQALFGEKGPPAPLSIFLVSLCLFFCVTFLF